MSSSVKVQERGRFGSKIGIVLAAAGSAVGLGNIWRFPTEAGSNGGAAFILVYILCILGLGVPLMISEFVIGRRSRASTGNAFLILAPGTNWKWLGRYAVFIAFLILSYYNVVAGWTLAYVYDAVLGNFVSMAAAVTADKDPFAENFVSFISDPYKPIIFLIVFMGMTHFVVTRGVEKGIEKFSKLLMPLLFLLLVALAISAMTMPGASKGLNFLFKPDFSAIDSKVVLSALGQCFYSLSLGMGCLCTYASYFRKDANLPKTAVSVAFMDTFVAIMAGIIIFPAVFSVPGLEPSAGPSLVFIALPNVFNSALASIPVLGYIVPILFYLLLVVATVTSTISLHEVITAFVSEQFKLSRHKAAIIVTVSTIILGIFCALSFGPLANVKLLGLNIFDIFDSLTAKIMIPTSAFFICIFVGWKIKMVALWKELTSYGQVKFVGLTIFLIAIRFVIPAIILAIMLSQFGLLDSIL